MDSNILVINAGQNEDPSGCFCSSLSIEINQFWFFHDESNIKQSLTTNKETLIRSTLPTLNFRNECNQYQSYLTCFWFILLFMNIDVFPCISNNVEKKPGFFGISRGLTFDRPPWWQTNYSISNYNENISIETRWSISLVHSFINDVLNVIDYSNNIYFLVNIFSNILDIYLILFNLYYIDHSN